MKFSDLNLNYVEHNQLWTGPLNNSVEIEVVGDKNGPAAEYAELAEKAIPRIDALVSRAIDYLNYFAKPPLNLTLIAILLGSGVHAQTWKKKQVEFVFHENEVDFYGKWTVGFAYEPFNDSLNPVQFSRIQE